MPRSAIRFLHFEEDLGRGALRAANRESILHPCTLELDHDVSQTNAFERPARLGDGYRLFGIHHQQIAATEVYAEIPLAPDRENDD